MIERSESGAVSHAPVVPTTQLRSDPISTIFTKSGATYGFCFRGRHPKKEPDGRPELLRSSGWTAGQGSYGPADSVPQQAKIGPAGVTDRVRVTRTRGFTMRILAMVLILPAIVERRYGKNSSAA